MLRCPGAECTTRNQADPARKPASQLIPLTPSARRAPQLMTIKEFLDILEKIFAFFHIKMCTYTWVFRIVGWP
jgi:hypothetical protein